MSDPQNISRLTLPGAHSRIETWVRFETSPPPVTTLRHSCLDNPTTRLRRELRALLPDTPTEINGHTVTYKFSRNVSKYTVDGVQCNFADALTLVTAEGGEHG